MKYFFSIITLWLALPMLWAQHFDYNRSFRYDFQLTGDEHQTLVFPIQMKEEPFYGGSKTKLIMPLYGDFLFQLSDPETNQVVFSKGFNSLYGEWLHSRKPDEKQLFYHAIQTPFPLKKLNLSISQRQRDGQFKMVHSEKISPDNYFIKKEKTTPYPIRKILYNGDATHKVDIAVIAEGYTTSELEKFYADTQRMIDYLFTIPPYNRFKKHFNIYAIGAISEESGTDIPGKNIYKNTILNSSFYTFDMERYLTPHNVSAIADIAALVPYDQIFVLTNTAQYGGAGFYNHLNVGTADHPSSPEVFVHEFGHGFVGLADEYYSSDTAFESIYNLEIEPWEPNITTLVDFDKKWKAMLHKKTPIPTPRTAKYKNTLGVFEGGGYVSKGIYSPVQDCRMKTNEAKGFCPVCSNAIEETINFYVSEK